MRSSIWAGRGIPLGGISPAFNLRRMVAQPSGIWAMEPGFANAVMLRPPDATRSLWHGAHVVVRTGWTVVGKSAANRGPLRISAMRSLRADSIGLREWYSIRRCDGAAG